MLREILKACLKSPIWAIFKVKGTHIKKQLLSLYCQVLLKYDLRRMKMPERGG